jgi:hypothetical protein
MRDFQDEFDPRASSPLAVPSDKEPLGTGAPAVRASLGFVPSNTPEALLRLRSRALSLGRLNYASSATLTACLFGFAALLAGTHLLGPTRTDVQQEQVQSSGMTGEAQTMADAPHAGTALVADMQPPQTPHAQDAGGPAIAKPRPVADRTEIGAPAPGAPGKAERARSKSAEKLPKAGQRVDRIGLKIAALLAAAPAADRSGPPAPAVRKLTPGGRGDAFDPARNPTAPGAPRPLGTVARAATAAEENEFGRRTN